VEDLIANCTMAALPAIASLLSRHVSPPRLARFHEVLAARIADTTLVFESLADPGNVSACMRTADALGVQDVHVVERWGDGFVADDAPSRGSARWLTIHRHGSTSDCIEALRRQRFAVFATSLAPASLDLSAAVAAALRPPRPRDGAAAVPDHAAASALDSPTATPPLLRPRVALLLGNEHRGASQYAREHADHCFHIAQRGFVESLNVSVACALALHAFLQRTPDYARHPAGPAEEGTGAGALSSCPTGTGDGGLAASSALRCERLSHERRQELLALWLMRTVLHSERILERAGLRPPDY
jgi:tRNA (guanosine-2'-O-)-methyltransferase